MSSGKPHNILKIIQKFYSDKALNNTQEPVELKLIQISAHLSLISAHS